VLRASRSQEVQPTGPSASAALCPAEFFPALDALEFVRTAFIQRCPGIDVVTDRETALTRLWLAHRRTADALGFSGMPFVLAEQVHGSGVVRVDAPSRVPAPAADGLITSCPQLCLAIYVADCAAVYLADKKTRSIGLIHAGKKGAQLGVVKQAIAAMQEQFGTDPRDLVMQISPCIRPPHYEVDFAADIVRQGREAEVGAIFDCDNCTACHPELYYSYRREKGSTGRLLALAAIT
jgi:copper oxidase (laccase) domain-containing protein